LKHESLFHQLLRQQQSSTAIMPDRGSDDERHSDSDEQAAPSSPGAEQQPLALTLRDRLKQKKAALLERTGRAAGSEQASTRGAGGFAGASLAAKRERLRQQREDRQVFVPFIAAAVVRFASAPD
jgi:hypothetical protein